MLVICSCNHNTQHVYTNIMYFKFIFYGISGLVILSTPRWECSFFAISINSNHKTFFGFRQIVYSMNINNIFIVSCQIFAYFVYLKTLTYDNFWTRLLWNATHSPIHCFHEFIDNHFDIEKHLEKIHPLVHMD